MSAIEKVTNTVRGWNGMGKFWLKVAFTLAAGLFWLGYDYHRLDILENDVQDLERWVERMNRRVDALLTHFNVQYQTNTSDDNMPIHQTRKRPLRAAETKP